jgi:hypothetical protein
LQKQGGRWKKHTPNLLLVMAKELKHTLAQKKN